MYVWGVLTITPARLSDLSPQHTAVTPAPMPRSVVAVQGEVRLPQTSTVSTPVNPFSVTLNDSV